MKHDKFTETCNSLTRAIEELKSECLPIPVTSCRCGGRIFLKGQWRQCPKCGVLTTAYGGFFPGNASDDWIVQCAKAEKRFAELYTSFE